MTASTISHQATGAFSHLVNDYLAQKEDLKNFFQFPPDLKGIRDAIEQRKKFPIDRNTLTEVVLEQYKEEKTSADFIKQIQSLKSENTFTVCTAHQPDLMTGYLYFFYKIIHAAKLSQYLKQQFPIYHFVPVFYIGSEDNDIEELSKFNFSGREWRWDTLQTGAVGRMRTNDLQPLLKELNDLFSPCGENGERLVQVISTAYKEGNTISQAIRHIVHSFLGKLGVVVIDADDARLKRLYLPVMKAELLSPKALPLVAAVSEKLKVSYQSQAYAREINLFYLKDAVRERIEREQNGWKVVNTEISWQDENALVTELTAHPERFSPNVILRGPYQESILPDVAFIGGGSEVAYWMQLGALFKYYQIFFPVLVLRQSALWMPSQASKLQQKLQLSDDSLFLTQPDLEKKYLLDVAGQSLDLSEETNALQNILNQIESRAAAVDVTLRDAAKSAEAKINHLLNRLTKKMIRAQKHRMSEQMQHIKKLKYFISPENKLQERHDCFLSLYLEYGEQFIDRQFEQTLPWGDRFLIIKEN